MFGSRRPSVQIGPSRRRLWVTVQSRKRPRSDGTLSCRMAQPGWGSSLITRRSLVQIQVRQRIGVDLFQSKPPDDEATNAVVEGEDMVVSEPPGCPATTRQPVSWARGAAVAQHHDTVKVRGSTPLVPTLGVWRSGSRSAFTQRRSVVRIHVRPRRHSSMAERCAHNAVAVVRFHVALLDNGPVVCPGLPDQVQQVEGGVSSLLSVGPVAPHRRSQGGHSLAVSSSGPGCQSLKLVTAGSNPPTVTTAPSSSGLGECPFK